MEAKEIIDTVWIIEKAGRYFEQKLATKTTWVDSVWLAYKFSNELDATRYCHGDERMRKAGFDDSGVSGNVIKVDVVLVRDKRSN
jgi:hypothetical protein